jgi:hypothetical protein
MPAEDMALGLMMLDNERVHWEVSHGDFRSLEGFELSDEEQRLLVEATRGVVAIDEEVPVPFRPGEEPGERTGPGGWEKGFCYWPPGAAEAIRYVKENLRDPRLAASFLAWQDTRGDIFP